MHKSFAQIGEFLNQCNFKGSGRNFFHRVTGSHVILVQLDGSPDGKGFTVSYGLHQILPGVQKIHHRDYLYSKCKFKGQVLNKRKNPVWNYHLDNDALATLTSRLLAGSSALETKPHH
ncbi:MAG: hypothetical protein ACC651_09700 [Candidatus Scalindua sp.]